MLGFFQRIWQWIQDFFASRLGPQRGQLSRHQRRRRGKAAEPPPPLTDADYEFLFSQLLEGVAHGWHEGRILKFFDKLGERGKTKDWVAWLERFGEKVLASPAPNLQLALRMIRLGELSQSFRRLEPIGHAAYTTGRQLYAREAGSAVWEYTGPDAGEIATPTAPVPEDPSGTQALEGETLTLEQLLARLQQEGSLARQMAQQLGLESADPQAIVEALIQQFQAVQEQEENQLPPETVEGWFQRGLQQAEGGDLTGAIASWDQALALNPQLVQAWHNRGSALGKLGQWEEALGSFERALDLDPADFPAWIGKGSALYHLHRWEAALAAWDEAVALHPDWALGWCNRGSALEKLGRPQEAIASFQKALEIQPDFDAAQSQLDQLSDDPSP